MSEKGQLSVIEFGKQLIETEDLDPVYVAMWNSELEGELIMQWTLAWMCYYHCGLTCTLVDDDGPTFFDNIMRVAKANEGVRGSQRVHHRGPPAIASATWLQEHFNTAGEWLDWTEENGMDAAAIYNRCCEMNGFGMCMSWRVPDIGECCGFQDAVWKDEHIRDMYDNPRRGALLVTERYGLDDSDPLMSAHLYVMEHLGHMLSPPQYTRTIGVQETETIFCKWKSHAVGRYEVGRDTLRARKQFLKFSKNKLSQHMLQLMPKGPKDA